MAVGIEGEQAIKRPKTKKRLKHHPRRPKSNPEHQNNLKEMSSSEQTCVSESWVREWVVIVNIEGY